MSKSDGTKIVIQFDDSILSGIEGSESAFEILVPEYDFVPGGTLVEKIKKVENVEGYTASDTIKLNMKPLEKFNNAAGPITVVYSGGYLMGEGGLVEPFEETFIPTDLIMKPNQMVRERLELSDISIDAQVIQIIYTDLSTGREQIQLSGISITAEVIPIDDI